VLQVKADLRPLNRTFDPKWSGISDAKFAPEIN
jgi:hypothetical protein